MKKLFLLAAAVMASFSLMAQTTLFSCEVIASGSNFSASTTETEITTSNYLSAISGGTLHMAVSSGSAQKVFGSDNSEYHMRLASDKAYAKITMVGNTFAEGDSIIITPGNANVQPAITAEATRSTSITTTNFKYAIPQGSDLIGKSVIYFWKGSGNVYMRGISIVRPVKDPILSSIKIAGVDAVIDQAAGTITAELPYGSNVEAAIAAIAEADVTLGGSAVSYEIAAGKLTVSDGAEGSKEYTFALTVAASASTDATLKSLKINGVDVEGFAADELSYEYEIAYAAELPVVTAEVNDPTANAVINNVTEVPGTATVVVTPQSGDEDKVTYSIAFTRKAAATGNAITAFKLNGIPGLIDAENHAIVVNYADFLASVDAATPVMTISELATIDKSGAQDFTTPVVYTVTSEAGEPQEWTVTVNIDAIPALAKANMPYTSAEDWDATPAFMYIVDGAFTADYKGGDYADHNVIRINAEGAVYFQLAACDSIHIVASATGTRNYRLEVVGGDKAVQLDSKGKNTGHEIKLAVESENPVLVKFSTPGANGGATLRSVKVFYTAKGGTALGNTEAEVKAVKRIVNGQLLIEKNGVLYNAQGAIVK